MDPVWNEVSGEVLSHGENYVHLLLQTLMWDCPGGLSGGDTLKVEVFDHETVGKNR